MLSSPLVGPLDNSILGMHRYGNAYPPGLIHLWNADRPTSRLVGPYPVYSAASQQPDADGNLVDWPVNHPGKGVMVQPAYTQLAQNSKLLNAVAGSPGTGPDNWTYTVVDSPTMAVTARTVGNSLTFSGTASRGYLAVNQAMAALSVYTFSFEAVCDGVLRIADVQYCSLTGGTIVVSMDGVVVADENAVPAAGFHTFSIKVTAGAVGDTATFRFGLGASAVATGSVTVYEPMLALSSYVMPYVVTGVGATSAIASTAATSAGNGLAIPMDSRMLAAFDGVKDATNRWTNTGPTGANWTLAGSTWTHTTGSVEPLSLAGILTIGELYEVVYVVAGRTAGSVIERAGSTGTLGYTRTTNASFTVRLLCGGSDAMQFVPTTDFNGSVTVTSVNKITQPSVFTAAALVSMGVGSGEMLAGTDTYVNSLSGRNNMIDIMTTYKTSTGSVYYCRTNDNTNNAILGVFSVWNSGEIHLKVAQTNSAGTQFRVGNRRYTSAMVPIDALTWGSWANYDGSMNLLTHLRFGYTTTVPIGFLQTQVWNKPATDAEILSLMRYAS